MIFYGWRKRVRPLLNIGTYHCSQCGDRPFHIIVNYSYFHLYWIFGFITGRRYIAACTNCSRGVSVREEAGSTTFRPQTHQRPHLLHGTLGLHHPRLCSHRRLHSRHASLGIH